MTIFDRVKKVFRSRKEPVSQEDLANRLWGSSSDTGLPVDRITAMRLAAVYAAVRVLSETLASLPVMVYKRIKDGKERATDHPLYKLLHNQPNPDMSAFYFTETLMHHVTLLGNGYAQIRGMGKPEELWPLDPERMKVERIGGEKVFKYTPQNGPEKILSQHEVFHVPGLGYDGLQGYSPIELQARRIGTGLATDRYGAEFFGNSAAPGGYIAMQGKLKSDDDRKRFKSSWNSAHTDWGNKHSVAVLEEGAEWKDVTIPPDQAQFIETMKFTVNEVARMFRLPPHMIGDLEHATFSNIEHQTIEFVVYSMQPWIVRWEQEYNRQLLSPADQQVYFVEYLLDGLLRGDTEKRWAAYRTAREIGVMNANEVRARENMNPVEDGDKYYVPLNWTAVDAPPPESMSTEQNTRSQKEERSGLARYKIAKSYQRIFADNITRILKREIRDIKKLIKKSLNERTLEDFDLAVDLYYQDYTADIRNVVTPAYLSLYEQIRKEVEEEIGIDGTLTPEDENFIAGYVNVFASRYAGTSKSDINKVVQQAIEENADIGEALEAQFEHWEEVRPASMAGRETTRGSNAFAKNMYLLGGVTKLRWVAIGKSCPYCNSLDGTIVGIESNFALPGDVMVGDNDKELNVERSIGHAPLHAGCDCQVVAV